MRILLLNPKSAEFEFRDPLFLRCGGASKKAPYILPPIGLAYLAAVLSKNFDVEIADLSVQEKSISYIRSFDCVIVSAGLSSIDEDLSLCRRIKTKKNAVGLCGITPSSFPEEIMKKESSIGFIIQNITPELSKISEKNISSSNFSGIENICFKKGGKLIKNKSASLGSIDSLPSPRYNLLPSGYYDILAKGKRIAAMVTSLGCPFSCNFCSANSRRTYSEKSLKRIFSEINTLCSEYDDILFWDDNFTADRKRCEKICDYLKTKKISFRCLSRPDSVDYDLLKRMKEAGCYQIQFGIESGSERMLSLMNKRLNLPAAKETLSACDRLGIETVAFFIMGYPGENESDISKTRKFIMETKPDFISLNQYIKMPGSKVQGKGAHSDFKNAVTSERIGNLYREYYLNLNYVLSRMKKLVMHPGYASLFIRQNIRFWREREGKLWKAIQKND
ncbi:MAG: radical SAM protein [Candidatus Woesearchaeota archaeon]|nr:radical SAM protein [Candidatus Woesearchaeota archaeon]